MKQFQLYQIVHFLLLLPSINAQSPTQFYSAFTSNTFTKNEGWEIMNIQSSTVYSDCGGSRLFGGFNLFWGEVSVMKLLQLPPHYKVQIKFQFWKIDSWDDEYFYLYLDEEQVKIIQFQLQKNGVSQCGRTDFGDEFKNIDISMSHKYSSLLIYITTNLSQTFDDEAWGMRDFYLYLYLCPPGCLTCEENDQIVQCIPWILLNSAYLSTTQQQFSYEGWLINNSFQKTSLCGNIPLFGGYQITGQNSIIQTNIDLPIHQFLKIQIRVAFIDSWDNEYLYIDIDNSRVFQQQYASNYGYGIQNICGIYGYEDSLQNIEFSFPHTQSSISLKVYTNLDQDALYESFGIRDFKLFSFYKSQCGNEIIEDHEQCDDGNLEPFDGCYMCQFSCTAGCQNCLYGECLDCFEGFRYDIFSNNCVQIQTRHIQYFYCGKQCKTCQSGNCIEYFDLQESSLLNSCSRVNHFNLNHCDICIDNLCLGCQNGYQFSQYDNRCIPIENDGIITIEEECEEFIQYRTCKNSKFLCPQSCQLCQFGICQICQESFILIDNKCEPNSYDLTTRIDSNDDEQCFGLKNQLQFDYFYEFELYLHEICSLYFQITSLKQVIIRQQSEYQKCQNDCIQITQNSQSYYEDLLNENCNEYCLVCKYNICLLCNYESQLMNDSCFKCGDGILNKINEQCDDLNNNNKDGCSQNCQIEKGFYCQHNEYQQFEYCERCLDQNCLYCYKVNNYFTQYCKLCQKGYFIDNNGQCTKCDQICLECINNHKHCLQFNYDYYKIKNCNQTQGFYYNFKLRECESKCGDGIIIKQEQCDDSNIYDYDGCSSKCEIEKGYLLDKQNNSIIKEPLEENIKIIQSISGELSLTFYSNLNIIECQKTTLSIVFFDSKDFKFNLTSNNQSCKLQIQYFQNIEPKNQIHIYLKYQSNYLKQRILIEYDQEIIVIPKRSTIPNNEQIEQGRKMAETYQSISSSIKYCIAFSLFFGGFNFIWAILDILSWINNFYFLNVNYPENVRQLFKQAEWGNVISFPQLEVLNQPNDSYYFQAPQKFQDKDVDPLFFNNIQFVIFLLMLNIITYAMAFSIKTLIQRIYIKQTNNKNKVSIFRMKIGFQTVTLGDFKQQPVKITKELQIRNIVKKIYYPCYYFEQNFLAILLKTIFISYFDISTAILLQLTNQQYSSHYVVFINIIFSYLTIIPLALILYVTFQITNTNSVQLKDIRFLRKYHSFYQDLNIESNQALQYSFMNLIRKTIFIVSTISLYYAPIYQTSVCFCACLINLMLLFQINPFINKQIYIQNVIPDFSVTGIVLISIILSFQDRFGKFYDEFINILGWIVVVLILSSIGLHSFHLILSVINILVKRILRIINRKVQINISYSKEKCK